MGMFKWFADLRVILSAVFSYRPRQSAGLNFAPSLATDWGAVIRNIVRAFEDAKANKPRPPQTPTTGQSLSVTIDRLSAILPVLKAYADAHPGELTAADDICDALTAAGFTWAVSLKSGVDAVPWMLAEASDYLPTLTFLLGEFAPAPIGIPGGWSGARGHV